MSDARRQVSFRLPPDLIRRIGHLAVEREQSRQQVIEEMLTTELDRQERARAEFQGVVERVFSFPSIASLEPNTKGEQ